MSKKAILLFSLLVVTGCFVVVSYYYLDKPIAWFVHNHQLNHLVLLKIFAQYPKTILESFFFVCFFYMFIKITICPLNDLDRVLLGGAVTASVALFIKTNLKMIFGRYWPSTFVCHNPSLIHHNAYGFHFLTKGSAYESFPSGHSIFIVTLAAYFWDIYPRYRWLYLLLVGMTVLGLLGMNYHFLSDIVAGIVFGCLIGRSMYLLLESIIRDHKKN